MQGAYFLLSGWCTLLRCPCFCVEGVWHPRYLFHILLEGSLASDRFHIFSCRRPSRYRCHSGELLLICCVPIAWLIASFLSLWWPLICSASTLPSSVGKMLSGSVPLALRALNKLHKSPHCIPSLWPCAVILRKKTSSSALQYAPTSRCGYCSLRPTCCANLPVPRLPLSLPRSSLIRITQGTSEITVSWNWGEDY